MDESNGSRSTLLTVTAACLVAVAVHGLVRPWAPVLTAVMAACLAVALWRRQALAIHIALAGTLWLGGLWIGAELWPLPLLAMLVVYGLVVWRSRLLRDAAPWLRRGTVDRGTWVAVASFVAVSAAALVVWRFGAGYDVSAFESFVPRLEVPTWLFFVGLWPFAMLNAAAEELLFRGVLFEGLQRWNLPPWTVNMLQAASFGLAHYLGFPGGWIGVGLATIYGLMMGYLRQRTGGLWIPWVAHVFADVTIYSMVVAMALP